MFKLVRYFSIASLIAIAAATLALALFYRQTAVNDLVELETSKNVALTQAFANSLWPKFAPFVASAGEMDIEALKNDPEILLLNEDVLAQIEGLSVVKIKIYDLQGLTVYSTEFVQIGEEKGDNIGFLSARDGQIASSLVHRDTFNTYDNVIEDRDLIQSYIPVRNAQTGEIEAVFELYSDVTPLIDRIAQTQVRVALTVTAILAVLYVALYFIVRRADEIIRRQYADLQQAYADLDVARQQAEDANRFKSQLIASVSHDLRTPLGVISGYSEMLTDGVYGSLNDPQRRVVNKVMINTQHLADLVSDMIYQAQLDAGKLQINKAPLRLEDLLDSLRNTMGLLAESRGLGLVTSLDPALPEFLLGDALHLKQILNNLVGNAIKFTEQGEVRLELKRSSASAWAIAVTDQGPGVPLEMRQRIYDPFMKSVSPETSKNAGLGLGLAIVKQVALLMGGDVALDSEMGQGSTFTVTLPLEPVYEEGVQ